MQFPLLLLGTAQLGMRYGIVRKQTPAESDENVRDILCAAWNENIAGVDTAMAYGAAPKRIGSFLESRRDVMNSWIICTKLPGQKQADFESLRKAWDGHIQELRCPSVFALLLHSAKNVSLEGMHSFCAALRESHVIKHFGVSAYSTSDVLESFHNGFDDVLEVPVNAFSFPQWEKISGLLQRPFVIARSLFLQGVLLQDSSDLPTQVRHLAGYVKKFQALCDSEGLSRVEGAFAVVASLPWISAMTVGVDSVEQLVQVVRSYRVVMQRFEQTGISDVFLSKTRDLAETIAEQAIDPRSWK